MLTPTLRAIAAAGLGRGSRLRSAYLILVPILAAVLIVYVPSVSLKLMLVLGVGGLMTAALFASRGAVLDPAWVVVAQLFFLIPVGTFLLQAGAGVSIVAGLAVAFLPFMAATLIIRPDLRSRLWLLSPLVMLGIYAGLTIVWSPEAAYGVEKLSIWALNGLLPAAVIVILASARTNIGWGIILGFAVAYAVGLVVIGDPWSEDAARRTLFDQNPIWAARAVMVGALIAIFGPFPILIRIISAPILLVAGLLTLSLGPMVGMAIGVLAGFVTALFWADRRTGRISAGWPLLAIAVGIGVVVLASGFLDAVVAPMVEDPNVTGRADLLGGVAPLIASDPLFGAGLGSYLSTGLDQYPHNLVAEIAAELGLVGLVAIGAWTAMAIAGAARSPLLMSLVIGTIAFTLFSGSLAAQTEFWMFSAFAVAALPALLARRRSRELDVREDATGHADGARDPSPEMT